MHQLRGSLLLTEAIEAEAIQRPKTVQDYLKTEDKVFMKLLSRGSLLVHVCDNSLDLVFGYLVIS